MNEPLHTLLSHFQLERVAAERFTGTVERPGAKRIYGGLVLAQAMAAAAATVAPERRVHSQHAYFLRAGDPKQTIEYEVDAIRDGGSFSTRRVVAYQSGRAILTSALSFQGEESGLEHRFEMPAAPAPEGLRDRRSTMDTLRRRHPDLASPDGASGIEYRQVSPPTSLRPAPEAPHKQVWMRVAGKLPDDQALQRILLVYMSDSYLLSTALNPHGRKVFDSQMIVASLDHALWMHADVDCSNWLLYDMDSPAASGGRGLSRGSIYQQDGRLVASTAQESLMRQRR